MSTEKKPKIIVSDKVCRKCNERRDVCNFNKNPDSPDGFHYLCKDCHKAYNLLRLKRIQEAERPRIEGKICSTCKKYLLVKEFCKDKRKVDGFNNYCRSCSSERKQKKKHLYNKQSAKWFLARKISDPAFRLVVNLRSRLYTAVKTQSKSAHTLELLGCTGKECMDYLERLFWPGMTRRNYGRNGWVVDHIVPIDSFDREDPQWQSKCFHYTNLQPLWFEDNNSKRARLDWTPQESKFELPERYKLSKDTKV